MQIDASAVHCDTQPDSMRRCREALLAKIRSPATRPMRLFMVVDSDRWGLSRNLVEAEYEEGAIRVVRPNEPPSWHKITVEPIELRGAPGIRWCEDVSPDSRE